jgi:hypothetical protein
MSLMFWRVAGIETFRSTLSTRYNNKMLGVIVVIIQRLNELDLASYCHGTRCWEHLKIEGEFEKRRVYTFPRSKRQIIRESDHVERLAADGRQTARIDDGGLLWPAREAPRKLPSANLT